MATANMNKPSEKSIHDGAQSSDEKSRITKMIKGENLLEWKGEAPSFEHFPLTQKGEDSQTRQYARYMAQNTDKIIGRQMMSNVTIIQMLEESKIREQGLIAQIGNLSNSHEELVGTVQDLRRELKANKCRCDEVQISDKMTHSVRFDENGYGLSDLEPPTSTNTKKGNGKAAKTANNGNKSQSKKPSAPALNLGSTESTCIVLPNANLGHTALMYAAQDGTVKKVELLLPKSDAKATTITGYTALIFAAKYGNDKALELLLPKSDAKATTNYGNTALMYAAGTRIDKSVEILLPKSDVKATNDLGYTALMDAAQYGTAKMVEILLPKSDVKATNDLGYTALMYAARHGNEKSVELLLPTSDVKATNNLGETALMLAAQDRTAKMVELLLPKSDAKATTFVGETALMLAARHGNAIMVELLLPKSEVKASNSSGYTALDIAKTHRHNQIVEILQQHN